MNSAGGENNNSTSHSGGFLPLIAALMVGITSGSAAGVGIFVYFDEVSPTLENVLKLMVPILGCFALLATAIVPLTIALIKRFTRNTDGTLDQVVRSSSLAVEAALQKDTQLANRHAEQALLAAVGWYAPTIARKWVVSTALSILVTMVGLIGTVLLYKQITLLREQNEKISTQIDLLKSQNEKLDQQTIVSEATRRGSVTAELLSILQSINNISDNLVKDELGYKSLPKSLASRVVAFSRTATPYYILNDVNENATVLLDDVEFGGMPRYIFKKISPERGQLLINLLSENIYVPNGAIFNYADLRNATLEDCKLDQVSLAYADFDHATITRCTMRRANISGGSFKYATISDVDLSESRAVNVNFITVAFFKTSMQNSNIYLSTFRENTKENCDLTGSVFDTLPFGNTDKAIADRLPPIWNVIPVGNNLIVKPK